MERFRVAFDESLAPRNKSNRTVFVKGVLAWRQCKSREDNPYVSDRYHHICWDRGWLAASQGKVTFEEIPDEDA